MSCSCKRCDGDQCACIQNGFICTDACLCKDCNENDVFDDDDNDDFEYSSDDVGSDYDE